MERNVAHDYTDFAELVDSMDTNTAAEVLAGMDRYYAGPSARGPRATAHQGHWVATQLVRRLAEPAPSDGSDIAAAGADGETEWARVRQRCLSVAVAMLDEAR